MLNLFRSIIDRLKAVPVVRAAQELEADALAHAAERQAELLTRANQYEAAGHPEVAGAGAGPGPAGSRGACRCRRSDQRRPADRPAGTAGRTGPAQVSVTR